jgi:glucose/arabinose dehydrogenase
MPRRPIPAALLVGALLAGCAGPTPSPLPPSAAATATASGATASTAPSFPPSAPASAPAASVGDLGPPPKLALAPFVGGLEDPLEIAVRPDHPRDVYVAEQAGRVRLVRAGELVKTPVLDIAGRVTANGEQGLLGLAFHPDPGDGRFFVYYTALDGSQIVSSFRMPSADADVADPDSETVLLTMADRFANHNGGALVFGPDGDLYVATGDGGGGGDPLDSGRHLDTLLAKVLRLDVDVAARAGRPYAIPSDNPFVDRSGARPEIWLTGLRNPWRMRFDRQTGDLWIGDVGQGDWEEIDVARAGASGLDYGWNRMEGFACYPSGDPAECATPDLTLPIAAYGHDQGCSVIGGTVYHGTAQPALRGWYVLADYCSGRVWVLDPVGDGRREPVVALDSGHPISAIGEDAAGELLVTDLYGGAVLRVTVAGS